MLRRTVEEDRTEVKQAICYVLQNYHYAYEATIHHTLFYLDYNDLEDFGDQALDVNWEKEPITAVFSPEVRTALEQLVEDGVEHQMVPEKPLDKKNRYYSHTLPENPSTFATPRRDVLMDKTLDILTEELVEWTVNLPEYQQATYDDDSIL